MHSLPLLHRHATMVSVYAWEGGGVGKGKKRRRLKVAFTCHTLERAAQAGGSQLNSRLTSPPIWENCPTQRENASFLPPPPPSNTLQGGSKEEKGRENNGAEVGVTGMGKRREGGGGLTVKQKKGWRKEGHFVPR